MALMRPDEGWAWVILFAACVIQVLISGINYAVGITQVALLERFHNSVTYTSLANGIFIFFISSAGVVGSAIINRYSCRTALIVGSVLMTSGLAASAVVESMEVILVTYGVIAGVGSGIVYTAVLVVVGFNFEKKRSMATGIAAIGSGFGTFIFPPLFQLARETYGNNGLFFIQASVAANICVFGSLCFPTTFERKMLAYASNSSTGSLSKTKHVCNRLQLLCHVSFLLICVSLLTSHVGIYMIYVHLTNYSISKGSTDIQASLLTSVIGIAGCLGRLCIGLMGNVAEISNMSLYFGTYGILGLATVFLQLYVTSYTGQMFYSIVFGTYCDCCYVLLSTITPDLLGIDCLASAFGLEMFFTGTGSLVGVLIAGVVVDSGGTYETAFTVAGVSILVAAVSVLAAETFRNVSSPTQKNTTGEEKA